MKLFPSLSPLLLIFLLLMITAGCELAAQTPQIVEVTDTPEPSATDNGPPRPTATPLPTPTPNLQELGIIKVQSCVSELNRHRGQLPFFQFVDAVSDESGSALGKFRVPDGEYGYQRWLPGPVYGTGKCAGASYAGWPTPTPDSRGGEHRIQQVADIAKEACNPLPGTEFRPVTETFALGFHEHRYQTRGMEWQTARNYYRYDAIDNFCVHTHTLD